MLFSWLLGICCLVVFLVSCFFLKYILLPGQLSKLCGHYNPEVIPYVPPYQGKSLATSLEKWWNLVTSLSGAPMVASVDLGELKKDHPLDVDGGEGEDERNWRARVSREVIENMKALRGEAVKEYFKRKKEGMAEASGEPPVRHFFHSWSGFWTELDQEERASLSSLLCILLLHTLTISLSCLYLLTGEEQWVYLTYHIIWGANLADLLIALFKPKENLHAARNIQQLVLHHLVTIVAIPLMASDATPGLYCRIILSLEISGGISVLFSVLSLTPIVNTHFSVIFVLGYGVMLYQRTVEWIVLSFEMIWPIFDYSVGRVGLCLLVVMMLLFNGFFLRAWMGRFGQIVRAGPYKKYLVAVDYPKMHILLSLILDILAPPVAYLFVLLATYPSLVHLEGFDYIWKLMLTLTIGYSIPLIGYRTYKVFESKSKVGSRTRKEISGYTLCKEILNSPLFSPAPYRYRHPKPVMKPFADWVRAMLLYNDEGHMRLKHSYPKLNQVKHVMDSYDQLLQATIQDLLQKAISESKDGTIDLMKSVCVKLPWIIMRYITGMPEKDIARAYHLISDMGNFVGKPYDNVLFSKALLAQREMVNIIREWTEQYKKDPGNLTSGVFPFWLHHDVFPSNAEYEANVVMLLFAGTHNLENMLGHGVRLLLQHPEALQSIREDPSLMDNALEEMLRFCPAIRVMPRTALREVVLSTGMKLNEGETVLIKVFEANRDESIHQNPNEFCITRKTARKHVTFGYGVHLCNGNQLGRLQIKRIIEAVLLNPSLKVSLAESMGTDLNWIYTYSHLQHLYLKVEHKSVPIQELEPLMQKKVATFIRSSGSAAFQPDIRNVLMHSLQKNGIFLGTDRDIEDAVGTSYISLVYDTNHSELIPRLLKVRDTVGTNSFKVAFLEHSLGSSLIDYYMNLKSSRFNLFVLINPKELTIITQECGFILLNCANRWDILSDFIQKRENVRWFKTKIPQNPLPEALQPSKGHLSELEHILNVAIEGKLFSSANDPKSGNISLRLSQPPPEALASFLITPRQVNKTSLTLQSFVPTQLLRSPPSDPHTLECYPPPSLPKGTKSSIDAGMQALLYVNLGWPCALFHWHYSARGPGPLCIPDTKTDYPFPCGVVEESLAVLDSIPPQLQNNPKGLLVELVHHGYLALLEEGGGERIHQEWVAVTTEGWKKMKEAKVLEDNQEDAVRMYPVWVGASIEGALGCFPYRSGSQGEDTCGFLVWRSNIGEDIQLKVVQEIAERLELLLVEEKEKEKERWFKVGFQFVTQLSENYVLVGKKPQEALVPTSLINPHCKCKVCVQNQVQ